MTDADDAARYEHAACGLLVLSGDGTILRANATFCAIAGKPADALVGRLRLQDLLTIGSRIFHQTHWAPLLQMQGSVAEVKLDLLLPDRQRLPVLINAVRRGQGAAVRDELAVFVATDRNAYERELLAQRQRAEQALAEARQARDAQHEAEARLREALAIANDRALFAEQLVGIVSHDLRSPIQAIQTSAEILQRLPPGQDTARWLASIGRSTRRARRLADDLLDFTAARVGRGLPVALEPVDPGEVVAELVDELRATYPGRAIEHERIGHCTCHADRQRIGQLVGNLVANAVAYGDAHGAITLRSWVEDGACRVSVHNFGPALPEDLMPRLFDPMVRGDGAPAGRGVGLGLFIVREIAQAHGGGVEVASSAERGTTFTLVLPRA
jgi:sigma-B regulation protein RsbU (phosphoserine phosphatase)